MNKKTLSERDICSKFITPAVVKAGWDLYSQIREEVTFTKGRIIVKGNMVARGKAKRADYILDYKPNIPLAIIEAKDNTHSVGSGMQQALEYAGILDIPFVFSSNGDPFLFHDRTKISSKRETAKTYTAFQIIWRLWKARTKKRILFLADRNILVDQIRINDFKPFGPAMTKIRNRQVDKSFEIYLALYQAVSGTEEFRNIYKHFSPDFFDLVIIDECHRGSATEDSAWREILEYFHTAAQIGMTATPKETAHVSNIRYFGDPVYTYSPKEGMDEGFLAPYKVIRSHSAK